MEWRPRSRDRDKETSDVRAHQNRTKEATDPRGDGRSRATVEERDASGTRISNDKASPIQEIRNNGEKRKLSRPMDIDGSQNIVKETTPSTRREEPIREVSQDQESNQLKENAWTEKLMEEEDDIEKSINHYAELP